MKLYISRKVRERFEFIETRLYWFNGITARDIVETFFISRPAAQKVISDYRNSYSGQMEYNPNLKKHEPSESFEPKFISTKPMLFLEYLRGHTLAGYYREEPEWSDLEVTDVNRLLRPKLSSSSIKTVLSALHQEKVVLIDYRQKDMDKDTVSIRLVSPNHLVFADDRYHIRAYCHEKKFFIDFVLSRIVRAEITEEEWISSRDDRAWNEFVDLRFIPNPDLPESVQKAILRNYEDQVPGIRNIRCRKAIAFYIKRRLLTEAKNYGVPLWCLEGTEKKP